MKQQACLILVFLLISFKSATCQSAQPVTPQNSPSIDTNPDDWMDTIFSLTQPILNSNNANPNDQTTPGSEPMVGTSQGMATVVRPDGTWTTTTYFTDENGVTTTDTRHS